MKNRAQLIPVRNVPSLVSECLRCFILNRLILVKVPWHCVVVCNFLSVKRIEDKFQMQVGLCFPLALSLSECMCGCNVMHFAPNAQSIETNGIV